MKTDEKLMWSERVHPDGYTIYSGKSGAQVCYTILEYNRADPWRGENDKHFLSASTEEFAKERQRRGLVREQATYLHYESFSAQPASRAAALAKSQELCAQDRREKMRRIEKIQSPRHEKE